MCPVSEVTIWIKIPFVVSTSVLIVRSIAICTKLSRDWCPTATKREIHAWATTSLSADDFRRLSCISSSSDKLVLPQHFRSRDLLLLINIGHFAFQIQFTCLAPHFSDHIVILAVSSACQPKIYGWISASALWSYTITLKANEMSSSCLRDSGRHVLRRPFLGHGSGHGNGHGHGHRDGNGGDAHLAIIAG